MNWFDTEAVLEYSPRLLGNKQEGKWWVTGQCDEQIGKYFRHLYFLSAYKTIKLIRPAWKEHITIVRNEEPLKKDLSSFWKKWTGQKVIARVFLSAETDGEYFWFPVYCEAALNLRSDLGLRREPEIPLHITIGHTGVKNELA